MKKFIKNIVSRICVIAMLMTMAVLPAQADDNIKVLLNGQEIAFDVPPQIINDRTMVPMRAISEALGYEVEWNQSEQTITAYAGLTNLFVHMQVGNSMVIYGDYTEFTNSNVYYTAVLDAIPQVLDGRTLVPVRAISEASGCTVNWNKETNTVIINTPTSITENTEQAVKYYLIYNYPMVYINNSPIIIRYSVFKNATSVLPFDYCIAMRTTDNNAIFKTIEYSNAYSNDEKAKIIDSFKNFEETVAKDLISQMPLQKYLGGYMNDVGDTYTYLSWTNFGDIVTYQYNQTEAGKFNWAPSYDYDSVIISKT